MVNAGLERVDMEHDGVEKDEANSLTEVEPSSMDTGLLNLQECEYDRVDLTLVSIRNAQPS